MKPLATPVLGGMISSLIHVLIVTPVIFFSIQERRLGLRHQELPATAKRPRAVSRMVFLAVVLVAAGVAATWRFTRTPSAGTKSSAASGAVVQTVSAGDIQIVLLSPSGTLKTGRNTFTIEFRSSSGDLIDAGTVRVTANMVMPGMVMSGDVQVSPAAVTGRYTASAEFGGAGSWQMSIEWNGPAGRGSATFEGAVQ